MSDDQDLDRAERVADAGAQSDGAAQPPAEAIASADEPTSAEYSVAFTPRNLAVGLAIVAGLIAFAASRRRRRSGDRDA